LMFEHQGAGLHYARVRRNRDYPLRHHIARQHWALPLFHAETLPSFPI